MNMRVVSDVNDSLYAKSSDLMLQWDFERNVVDPSQIYPNYSKKVWWLCEKGHSWKATPNKRYGKGTGCPYCSNRSILKGYNDLATLHPELVEEWDFNQNNVSPSELSCGSHKIVYWKCKSNHSWKTSVECRVFGKTGCPYCNGKYAIRGQNDCATLYPSLLEEWDMNRNNLDLFDIKPGDDRKYWWICNKGHHYKASPNHRTRGRSCPYCAGKKVLSGFNDLMSQYPKIASEWDYDKNDISPDAITAHSNKVVWWKCDRNHSWKTKVNMRISNHTGCPICNNSHGENAIQDYLEHHNIRYIPQYIFNDRYIIKGHYLKDDFALLDKDGNVVATIEYHGIQHYEPVDFYGGLIKFEQMKKLDNYKSKYLSDRKIMQIVIPYTDYNNIDVILDKSLYGIADKISK